MPSASAAENTPLFTSYMGRTDNRFWEATRNPPVSTFTLYESGNQFHVVASNSNTFMKISSFNYDTDKSGINFTVIQGKRYLITFDFILWGNVSSIFRMFVDISAGTQSRLFEFETPAEGVWTNVSIVYTAPVSSSSIDIDLHLNMNSISSGYRQVTFRNGNKELKIYDYDDMFENPRSGVASGMDGARDNLKDTEEAALGGRNSDEVQQELDDALEFNPEDFITPTDLLSINWFFARIYTAFGDYSFLLTFSCVVGLAAVIIGRGSYILGGSGGRSNKSNYKNKK